MTERNVESNSVAGFGEIATILPAAKDASTDNASKSVEPTRAAVDQVLSTAPPVLKPDDVLEELRKLKDGSDPVDLSKLQVLLKDYDSLREKVGKLKSLLGRSAKAQREAKVELDATQKRLDASLREIDRLNKRIDKLANRPTHMELLADFEANFDRALLQMAPAVTNTAGYHQEGGEGTASPAAAAPASSQDDTVINGLLLQELADFKQRIEKLESLNGALVNRSTRLESEALERKRERDELLTKLSHMELEKRMAVLEAEQATKALHDTELSLKEMQLEIDMVTKASVTANVRAAHGEQLIKAVKTDKQHVQKLEAKVQALQEWALASSEAKTLAQERIRLLEAQLHSQQVKGSGSTALSGQPDSTSERILFAKGASLVVGAGDVAVKVFTLTEEQCRTVRLSERVVLRWQFDLTQEDATIDFSIAQADCSAPSKRKNARFLVANRLITGGAAGETENAFALENACTLVWSNAKAWIRPKTVKYSIEAVVIAY